MTRSCKHFETFESEQVLCDLHGLNPIQRCSGCSDFQLVQIAVPESPPARHEPKQVFLKCQHLASQRKCCPSLWICRKHGDITLTNCETCSDWSPQYPIAPRRNEMFQERPWEGGYRAKPWNFRVTVAIPVLDASEAVSAIVELYSLQTEKPFILLIDTGSTPEELAKLQALASESCEVHSLRLNGVKHPSDFPAMAMDLAFAICRTDYLLATHADCFPTSQEVCAELLSLCGPSAPVVGYEITERPHSDWHGMVGHTFTMFHMPTMDDIGASWSLRRLVRTVPHPDGKQTGHEINPATSPNWPDTELLVNYQCRRAGITPVIIGTERNAARTTDHRIDHCRSWASARLYSSGSDYAEKSNGWLEDGIAKAMERAAEWR